MKISFQLVLAGIVAAAVTGGVRLPDCAGDPAQVESQLSNGGGAEVITFPSVPVNGTMEFLCGGVRTVEIQLNGNPDPSRGQESGLDSQSLPIIVHVFHDPVMHG